MFLSVLKNFQRFPIMFSIVTFKLLYVASKHGFTLPTPLPNASPHGHLSVP